FRRTIARGLPRRDRSGQVSIFHKVGLPARVTSAQVRFSCRTSLRKSDSMHTKLAVLLTVFVFAVPCYAAFEDSSVDDTQAVEQVSAQFYKSLNVMFTGDAAPMLQVWSQADDVTYMGPAGGIQV